MTEKRLAAARGYVTVPGLQAINLAHASNRRFKLQQIASAAP